MNEPSLDKPLPDPSPDSQPFWDGLREHRLVLQKCTDCGKIRHYPRPVCDGCYSMDHTWHEATGRGVIYSWIVCHHAFHPGFKRDLPYTLLTVEMDEGVRIVGRAEGIPDDALEVGLPVQLGYEDGPDVTLPTFSAIKSS